MPEGYLFFAGAAVAASDIEGDRNQIANFEAFNVFADFDDFASDFMS